MNHDCHNFNAFYFIKHSDGVSYTNAVFGAGTGPIFLESVQCSSSSSQLLECHSNPVLTVNSICAHSRDAGVRCEGLSITMYNACLYLIFCLHSSL